MLADAPPGRQELRDAGASAETPYLVLLAVLALAHREKNEFSRIYMLAAC